MRTEKEIRILVDQYEVLIRKHEDLWKEKHERIYIKIASEYTARVETLEWVLEGSRIERRHAARQLRL